MRRVLLSAMAGTLALTAAALSGCSSFGKPDTADPSWSQTACPDWVTQGLVGESECGFVEVPVRRDGEGSGQVKVFATRVMSGNGDPSRDPILVLGGSIGMRPTYAGLSPLAQRTGRPVIIVNTRGTGFSQPSLACPEVAKLEVVEAGQAVTDAVAACHDRLADDGIDLGAFGIAESAADLEDLRRALGVDTWTVASYGGVSRIAVEYAARWPAGVRALILDSPELPGMDPHRTAGTTPGLVRGILATCAQEHACATAFPATTGLLRRAVATLEDAPLVIRAAALDGGRQRLVLDPQVLFRLLRQLISDGGSSGAVFVLGAVPWTLDRIAVRDASALADTVGPQLLAQQSGCVGYTSHCGTTHDQSLGVRLTVYCHDLPPEPATGMHLGADLYDSELCAAWPLTASPREPVAAPRIDIPTFMTVGRFAPYSPRGLVAEASASLTNASLFVDPTGGDNVITSTECLLNARNAWLDHPTAEVRPLTCLAEQHIDWRLR